MHIPILLVMAVALIAVFRAEVGNVIFGRAVLYIDPDGTGSNNIELAELQNLSFETRDTKKTLDGKDIWPIAQRLASRNVTIRAQWARVQAQGIAKINGADVTYADDKTTIHVKGDSYPDSFMMRLSNPTDGSEMEMIFYCVTPSNFTLPLQLKEFTQPNAEFDLAQDDEGRVYDIILPGYQSVN